MKEAAGIRTALFVCGVSAILLSLALVVGSFLRRADTTDYLKQADEGVPLVLWGSGSGGIGSALCFFGRRWWRVAAVGLGLALSVWWILIGGSLY
jgi:hypothetical protein